MCSFSSIIYTLIATHTKLSAEHHDALRNGTDLCTYTLFVYDISWIGLLCWKQEVNKSFRDATATTVTTTTTIHHHIQHLHELLYNNETAQRINMVVCVQCAHIIYWSN